MQKCFYIYIGSVFCVKVKLMVLEINSNQPLFGVQSNYSINPIQPRNVDVRSGVSNVNLEQKPDKLSLSTNVQKYATKEVIIEMINANPEIANIMQKNGIPLQINMKNLDDLMKHHLQDTKNIVNGIVENLPGEIRKGVNITSLQKAAALHDFGKVLIPNSIISKKGKLDEKESEIMQQHSILGYELLKTTDLDNKTLELIKYHHQNAQKTGYPKVNDIFVSDVNSQILYAADIYSALTEERPYKEAMNKNQALGIIHKDMKDGKIHPYVFKALVDYANKQDNLAKLDSQRQISNLKPVNSLSA